MKNMKKLVGIIMLATALILSTFIPSFATDITITGGAEDSVYSAFKLLNATDGGDGKYAYTLNDTYTAVLQSVTGKTEQADIVAYIQALDSEAIADFAEDAYAAIVVAGIEADAVSADAKFTGVEQGYYLIAETALGNTADTYSLVMLDTAGQENIEVSTKEDIPSVEKKVEEKNDTTGDSSWGDSADYDIGDSISYKLTGTVSAKYADYGSYFYRFNDTMEKGLTYNKDAKVYIVNGEVKTEVTDQFDIVSTDDGFTATSNLKELTLPEGVTITATTTVVVEYTCTLNEEATKGTDGNENRVYIEYENNPSVEADGNPDTPDEPKEPEEPGKSEEDVNVVFTFDAVVNKTDKDKVALAGAGFTLYKNVKGEYEAVGTEITGVTTFTFEGLDAGIYKLVETTVPEGYNKADDVVFEVVPTYDTTTDPHTLTALAVENEAGEVISTGNEPTFSTFVLVGKVETTVVNVAGTELPSTGGVGTTIFYIAGGILVVAAVVLLVAKKRMGAEG